MAERPKISIKPSAPARDPHRPRVRGVTSPRPAPSAKTRSTERDVPPATPAAPAARPRPPAPRDEAPRRETRPPPRRDERPAAPRAAPRNAPPSTPAPRVVPAPQRAAPARPAAPAAPRPASADGVRVSKLITERGLASRREADDWIAAGWVKVQGRMAELGQRVPPDAVIDIDPRAREEQARQVTVLLHKPMGIVSGQAEDGYEPAITLVTPANRWSGDSSGINFHPGHLRHLAPAGRLDIDSTGLLVFTQDGRVAKRLIGDQTRVEKEYLVRVAYSGEGRLPEAAMEQLRHGLSLDGVLLRPAAVSWQNEEQLRFVLREGRKRQIRRMCEQVGLQVLGLKRVRIGSVPLGQLPPGQWRYLRDDERF
ncbi:MAG: pseudouridine synthase [Rubrivivax sp.]|nr:pseudouridine synthase [Rubrivivax sp.]